MSAGRSVGGEGTEDRTSRGHILLVEDNDGDARILTDVIAATKWRKAEIHRARTIGEARQQLTEDVGLVLLDIGLPDARGVEAFRAIREAASVPVVVLSGMEDQKTARRCLEEGAQDYVNKNELSPAALHRAIEFALARWQASDLSRRLQRADRLASIGQLAAGVAHEVSNPAAFVHANCVEIQRRLESFRARLTHVEQGAPEVLEDIEAMAEMARDNLEGMSRIVAVVRGLTMYARDGREELEDVDIQELCRGSISLVAPQMRHHAGLEVELQPTPRVRANADKLGQVVVNLLINAAHATAQRPDAHQRVTVRTAQSGARVILSVSDTGPGIPARDLDRIFQPFFTTKAAGEGTGLGLALSREIVESFGGRINVQTEVGVGTTFEVVLPVVPSATLRPGDSTPRGGIVRRARTRRRVMLIDDEVQLTQAVARALQRSHDIVAVSSGREALQQLQRDPGFDVIICDLLMPGMDGVATIAAIGSLSAALAPRVIVMSGGAATTRSRRFVESTSLPVLEKPVRIGDLLDVIERVAAHSS